LIIWGVQGSSVNIGGSSSTVAVSIGNMRCSQHWWHAAACICSDPCTQAPSCLCCQNRPGCAAQIFEPLCWPCCAPWWHACMLLKCCLLWLSINALLRILMLEVCIGLGCASVA
jgi:hypothetical protein